MVDFNKNICVLTINLSVQFSKAMQILRCGPGVPLWVWAWRPPWVWAWSHPVARSASTSPSGVGLETPWLDPPQLPPWVWALTKSSGASLAVSLVGKRKPIEQNVFTMNRLCVLSTHKAFQWF